MKSVYIVSAKRTPIGSLLGTLKTIPASMLASKVIKAILADTKIESNLVNEVIIGQVLTAGAGQNPARQASIYAGLESSIPAFTINQVCGSGLKSICLGVNSIIAENAECIIAGGAENMSLGLHGSYIRAGAKFGNINMIDLMQYDGLTDAFSNKAMGITAENIAQRFSINRRLQDEFAFNSQQKASKAQIEQKFANEIVPIEINTKKDNIIISYDEGIRSDTTIERLNKLQAAFIEGGTVTAGNASSINDGSAAIMIASENFIKKYNITPLARVVSYAYSGVDPDIMGTGPVPASKLALKKAGWTVSDLDLIECNEAFAAQAIYVNQEMQWDIEKVNVNGGAIALGHPIGASGSRILVTLIHEMLKRQAKKGLATLCIGGGMGISMCIENVL